MHVKIYWPKSESRDIIEPIFEEFNPEYVLYEGEDFDMEQGDYTIVPLEGALLLMTPTGDEKQSITSLEDVYVLSLLKKRIKKDMNPSQPHAKEWSL